jgi:hypothetical protein
MSTGAERRFSCTRFRAGELPTFSISLPEEAAVRTVVACCLVALLAFPLMGCSKDSEKSPTDPAGAEVAAQAGDQALANGDVAAANSQYRAALGKDPQSGHANLGAAVTEIALLQSDPTVDSLMNLVSPPVNSLHARATSPRQALSRRSLLPQRQFDPMTVGRAATRLLYQSTVDPTYAAWYQTVLRTRVMPRLQYAEDRLNTIEGNPAFNLIIQPAVSGAPEAVEVDLGEVLAMDALINSVQGVLGVLVAYNFDVPPDATTEELLDPTSHFAKLLPDGAAQLAAAHLNLGFSFARFNAMVTTIHAETDDQSDDAIPLAALETQDFAALADGFAQAELALAGTVQVDVTDYLGNPTTIDVNISKFFDAPIADFKAKLPGYTIDVDGNVVVTDPITFPDPKFNLIFPNMDNAAWQALIGPVPGPSRPF